ncbi:hypothetical protein PCC7418_2053 [Halothece sp. PCC 7418]|uniref:DUF4334 domain-containing protein n=1 Tax=Halothece sp. (strain PCC 7418) TaxID=65093 RepID=UPI0002A086DA|nr:DUF4334 domain-containing protein [Halothece sp. PCC 7418]AFZ44216.1 hypothetical protein PCC7418_2053 [Halothece sp. PCC 7418]
MNTLEKINLIQKKRETTTEEALTIFDELAVADLDFMIGQWQGFGIHTNHPMDGLLELFDWYGKEFISPEQVHPLLFLDQDDQVIAIKPDPALMKLAARWNFPKAKIFKLLFRLGFPLLTTQRYKARLRMMEYRQKVSATMIYDQLPIQDTFRKVDEDTVFGVMDFKTVPQPFFFMLKRVESA